MAGRFWAHLSTTVPPHHTHTILHPGCCDPLHGSVHFSRGHSNRWQAPVAGVCKLQHGQNWANMSPSPGIGERQGTEHQQAAGPMQGLSPSHTLVLHPSTACTALYKGGRASWVDAAQLLLPLSCLELPLLWLSPVISCSLLHL